MDAYRVRRFDVWLSFCIHLPFFGLFRFWLFGEQLGSPFFLVCQGLRGRQILEAKAVLSHDIEAKRSDALPHSLDYVLVGQFFRKSDFEQSVGRLSIDGRFNRIRSHRDICRNRGNLSDLVGRKRVVITGFVILGIEYAILSLFSGDQASWYIYTLCDGTAWGLFASVFFMTIWGDLAETNQKEKYYVIGGLPYLLAGFMAVVVQPFADRHLTCNCFFSCQLLLIRRGPTINVRA